MNSVPEATQNWLSLPLLILVSAIVALSVYFLMRRPQGSNPEKTSVGMWVILVLIACAGFTSALFVGASSSSFETPAALFMNRDDLTTPVPIKPSPHNPWKVESNDSWSKWKAYEKSIEQAGVLPTRPPEKSWVDHPHVGNIHVGYSVPAVDAETAMQQARDAASQDLLDQLAQNYWKEAYKQYGGRLPLPLDDLNQLATQVIYRQFDSLVLDTYEEVLPRPLGTVYRAAVKVAGNPTTLHHLTDEFITEVHGSRVDAEAKRRDLVSTSISAAALALVILVLYFFLNAGTKGYFAWPLRFISLTVLLAIYAGWFYLKGWI